jgi:hypothetical protein
LAAKSISLFGERKIQTKLQQHTNSPTSTPRPPRPQITKSVLESDTIASMPNTNSWRSYRLFVEMGFFWLAKGNDTIQQSYKTTSSHRTFETHPTTRVRSEQFGEKNVYLVNVVVIVSMMIIFCG